MKLSNYFKLYEMVRSQTADRHCIDNTPQPFAIMNASRLARNVLDPVREHFGIPFSPSSWYRCPELNDLVNGSKRSQHMTGEAADIEIPGISNYELAKYIIATCEFDQLIWEYPKAGDPHSGWIHVSYVLEGNRRDVRTFTAKNGYEFDLVRYDLY